MKTFTFIAIALLSGTIAGLALGLLNQVVLEPYVEQAINLEVEDASTRGELIDPAELANYRMWQRTGSIAGAMVLGISFGALLGLVFAYTRNSLPGSTNLKKALILAGIMWFVLYFVVTLKYPSNPPAVGDPETIYYRQGLYVMFLAISGFTALSLAYLSRVLARTPAKKVLPIAYAAIMTIAFISMPENPDEISAPIDLVTGFRLASTITMSVFWILAGAILGIFWDKLKPHEKSRITTV